MARKLRTTSPGDLTDIARAVDHLASAREWLKAAGCPKASRYAARALKSAMGAYNHAQRAFDRHPEGGRHGL